MKPKYLMIVGVLATVVSSVTAEASIVPVFSVNSAGETVEVDLTLNLSADPGLFSGKFSGGIVALGSGTGEFDFFAIMPGLTTETFRAFFDYPTAGTFDPSYTYATGYTEKLQIGRFGLTLPEFRMGDGKGTLTVEPAVTAAPAVPELSSWAMMLLGFAGIGFAAFRRTGRKRRGNWTSVGAWSISH
jgi:hypothetical protein